MERIVKIYVLKNPQTNNIHYVGRTLNEKTRYRQHIFLAKHKKNKDKKSSWIISILNKGLKPIMEIIEEVTESNAIEREMYWIRELRKTCDLKNERDFIENGYIFSEEARKKMSDSQKGNTNRRGKKLTKEQCYNMGNANRHRKKTPAEKAKVSKPILQYDLDMNFIKEWSSAVEASIALNTRQSSISLVAQGKRNSWYNFIFRFKN